MTERQWELEIINKYGEEMTFPLVGKDDAEMIRNAYELLKHIKKLTHSDIESHLICLIDEEEEK